MRKSFSSYLLYLLITVLMTALFLGDFTGLKKVQWKIDDLLYSFRGEKTIVPEIVLVNIDDISMKALGDWPWSYEQLADLVAVCNSGEPRSILLNLELPSRINEDTTGRTGILANQVSWAENIVLTYDVALGEYGSMRMTRPQYLFRNAIQVDSELGFLEDDATLTVRKPLLPSPLLSQYADGLGFSYIERDKDRHVRWAPLVANHDGFYYPSAPLLAASLYLGYGPDDIVIKSDHSIKIDRFFISTDKSAKVSINFNNPKTTFSKYSAVELMNEQVNFSNLKDRLLIIGLDDNNMGEYYKTPVSQNMSRSELFANVIENIIHTNYLHRFNISSGVNVLILIAFGIFCAVILPRVTFLYRMVILFVCLFILANLCFILFNSYNMLTRSLYLGLEIVLFMVVSPLLEESKTDRKKSSGFRSILKTAGARNLDELEKREQAAATAVRTSKTAEKWSSFQETDIFPVEDMKKFDATAEPKQHDTEHMEIHPERSEDKLGPPADAPLPPGSAKEEVADDEPISLEPNLLPSESVSFSPDPLSPDTKPSMPSDTSSSPLINKLGDSDGIKNLGRYQVEGILGKGAMGTVFRGIDPAIDRPVALKTIRLDFVSDQDEMCELRDRLFREAQAAGRLSHPNIVTIYDIGSEQNLQYIAMEFLEGQTLENLIKKEVQFSYRIIAQIITQICMALQYAHDQGIVHRDIKPANIMILPDYSVKVMDFGIARVDSSSMTRDGIAMGTPNYISPELLQGKEVDRRCDIFSLGVVIYELLSGQRPFKGENLTALIYSIINDDPPPPSSINENVPPIFDHITGRALKKSPLERYQKASDIIAALSDFVGSFSGTKSARL